MRVGATSGTDPFEKVKSLISDMIGRLEKVAESEAKKAAKTAEINKLSTKIDQMSAKSSMLKEEVAALQSELASLAKAQSEMDSLREKEHDSYVSNKADMEKGLNGVKLALKVLNEYYAKEGKAHTAADGAGASIIGLLEVVESDFSKDLAEIESVEETSAAEYETETKENAVEKTTKDKDVEYKTKESAFLTKEAAEHSSDRSSVQAELDAVEDYLSKIHVEYKTKESAFLAKEARYEAE